MPTKVSQSDRKKIPKLRFPGFEGEWEEKEMREISMIYDGTHQTPKYVNEGIKFVSVENIGNIEQVDKFITREAFEKDFKIRPQRDDILMTRITAGIIGATAIVRTNDPLGYYVSLALIRKKEGVTVDFLNQLIHGNRFKHELHKRIIHVAFPKKINLGDIGRCSVFIPNTAEQQKIADFLTSIDQWIETLRVQKETLEAYKKEMTKEIFTQEIRFKNDDGKEFPEWKEKRLGEIAYITTGSSNREDSTVDGDYTFFDRSEDIRASSRYLFDTEAIIVAGEGQEFRPKYFVGKFDLHQRTYAIMNFKNSLSEFMFYYISYNRKYFNKMAVGSTVPSLRLPMFNNMPISLPITEEQQKIADFLTSIDRLMEAKQKQITQAEQWKKGLMQNLFV
ncbi:MAG: restriction endonuclease subunit S [Candidatus Gracilibacteria bacterium]